MKRLVVVLWISVVAAAVGLAGLLGVMVFRPAPQELGSGVYLTAPFELMDQTGRVVMEKDFRARPTAWFFGFTHCPDVCPTTLFEVSEVMRALGKDADRAAALFITVDPARDTPAKMKDYLQSFDPHLRGLTGDEAAIAAVQKAYRVYSKKVPVDGGEYTMDHTALVYLMDKEGRFVAPFNLKRPPEAAAADLRKYL